MLLILSGTTTRGIRLLEVNARQNITTNSPDCTARANGRFTLDIELCTQVCYCFFLGNVLTEVSSDHMILEKNAGNDFEYLLAKSNHFLMLIGGTRGFKRGVAIK
jgi:hypothetical protein